MAVRILVNPNLSNRQKYLADFLESFEINKNHPDVLYINDDNKLGVEASKQIRNHLALKPFSFEKRIVLLESGHKLTVEAQNALLKTLEEPPVASDIILGVEKLDNLLDTVISRCEIVYLEDSSEFRVQNSESEIDRFINQDIPDRFKQIEKMDDREKFLEAIILYYRNKLHQGEKVTKLLNELLIMQQWIYSNVNDRAILEYTALIIPTSK